MPTAAGSSPLASPRRAAFSTTRPSPVERSRFATILPRIVVQRAVNEGTLSVCPILSPRIVRHVVRISHKRRPLSAATHALIDLVADEIRRVLSAGDARR